MTTPSKRFIKHLAARGLTLGGPWPGRKIVVASTGRAGSTMLFEAILAAAARYGTNPLGDIAPHFTKRVLSGYVDRLTPQPACLPMVIKTHDLCPPILNPRWRYLFVYGDPLESILSVEKMVQRKGLGWFRLHQYHLRANGHYDNRYHQDVLNFEGQVRSWLRTRSDALMVLRYEEIWDRSRELEAFLEMPVDLPRRRDRAADRAANDSEPSIFPELRQLAADLSRHRHAL